LQAFQIKRQMNFMLSKKQNKLNYTKPENRQYPVEDYCDNIYTTIGGYLTSYHHLFY